jgi:hypothetical protein
MTRKTIDELYAEGRHYPSHQPRRENPQKVNTAPSLNTKGAGVLRSERVQDPEAARDDTPRYSGDVSGRYFNDASGWVRGAPEGQLPNTRNETAERYPHFDRGGALRMKNKGIDWRSGSDPAVIRRPERNKP